MFFYLPKLAVFSETGNNPMRALGRKKHMFVFGNALPTSNARAHLKQRKKTIVALSEAKLAYTTAWAMGEEGKVVIFLKRFTDRAFAGHLLRTVQANILGTASEVALKKEAEQK